ncbi:ABC transporter ATP-binding protein [Cyanobium sp. CH-040]|uniref:ABC transporter ATP-binding protein n=1 Tax=Cyanobium sp. CH-040 TaxID=2823708 RepID=UPI0020CE6B6B|nr:ABC transporter ATP-binding protein [Cyanobium sp. CH-040]MCP9927201.1 ABC transporter ATP-binding protein [Cyanobium sp. CH-040]
MDDDVLVRVENVSKRFCRSLKRSLWYGLQDLGSELGGRRHGGGRGLPQSSADVQLRPDEFWAVKDVSFELRRGECLGLIGRNGAGKTTLLRMLNGLIKPDTGRIQMRGKVEALIALGTGFNPILSGRENIFVNASVHGFRPEIIRDKIDEIIGFSELESVIDSPVQTYSSGMQVRLGFAIATAFQPDILLLDEVLSVGDARFRAKCNQKMSELRTSCATIVVSHHHAELIRACQSGLLLTNGTSNGKKRIDETYRIYRSLDKKCARSDLLKERLPPSKQYISSFPALVFSASVSCCKSLATSDRIEILLNFTMPTRVELGTTLINFIDEFEEVHATLLLDQIKALPLGKSSILIKTSSLMLSAGTYFLHVYFDTMNSGLVVSSLRACHINISEGPSYTYSSHIIDAKSIDIVSAQDKHLNASSLC